MLFSTHILSRLREDTRWPCRGLSGVQHGREESRAAAGGMRPQGEGTAHGTAGRYRRAAPKEGEAQGWLASSHLPSPCARVMGSCVRHSQHPTSQAGGAGEVPPRAPHPSLPICVGHGQGHGSREHTPAGAGVTSSTRPVSSPPSPLPHVRTSTHTRLYTCNYVGRALYTSTWVHVTAL